MSSGRPVDDALSRNHIDEAIKTLASHVRVEGSHWIPYLGGYSKDWSQQPEVYFDARLPDTLKMGSKEMSIKRYLLIHECVEKSLMDELGLSYEVAHDFATSAERSAVEADGYNWADYTRALQPFIHEAARQPEGMDAPQDLDLTPYEQEHAKELSTLALNEKKAP
jgi:hypothetical protein